MKHLKLLMIVIHLFGFVVLEMDAQTLTLQECYEMAEKSLPLRKNIELREKISALKIENLNSQYLPQFHLSGKAQYQSDVTQIDMDIPIPGSNIDFPKMPNDQYQISLGIQQLIWDGGITAGSIDLEKSQKEADIKNTEIKLYEIRNQVNSVYFAVFLFNEKIKIFELTESTLNDRLKSVRTAVDAGMVLKSNAEIIEAEILNISQNILEAKYAKKTASEMLGELIDKDLSEETELHLPSPVIENKIEDKMRPEFSEFNLQRKSLETAKQMNEAKYMPKIYAFAQGIYAKPGLNMFSEDFKPYFIAGIQAEWYFWNWNKSSREEQIFEIQKQMLDASENSFTKKLSIEERNFLNSIEKLEKMIVQDKKIIEMRTKIASEAAKQLGAGVITSTEYITELNKQKQSEISLEVHKLELIKTKVEYQTFLGNK